MFSFKCSEHGLLQKTELLLPRCQQWKHPATFICKDLSRHLELQVLGDTTLILSMSRYSAVHSQQLRLIQVRLRCQFDPTECLFEAVTIIHLHGLLQLPTNN